MLFNDSLYCTKIQWCPFILYTGDCKTASVSRSSNRSQASVQVRSSISTLAPVHSRADSVTLYIWSPTDVTLDVSTTRLYKVSGWMTETCDANRFQTARLSATANFVSGSSSFRGDVYSLIARQVSYSFIC